MLRAPGRKAGNQALIDRLRKLESSDHRRLARRPETSKPDHRPIRRLVYDEACNPLMIMVRCWVEEFDQAMIVHLSVDKSAIVG